MIVEARKAYIQGVNAHRVDSIDGEESKPETKLLDMCTSTVQQSRTTYLEANLIRHLRKSNPGQTDSNSVNDYIEKYSGEVSTDDVLPWIYQAAVRLMKDFTPEKKVPKDGKLVLVKVSSLAWR